jgi:thymidine kinase
MERRGKLRTTKMVKKLKNLTVLSSQMAIMKSYSSQRYLVKKIGQENCFTLTNTKQTMIIAEKELFYSAQDHQEKTLVEI